MFSRKKQWILELLPHFYPFCQLVTYSQLRGHNFISVNWVSRHCNFLFRQKIFGFEFVLFLTFVHFWENSYALSHYFIDDSSRITIIALKENANNNIVSCNINTMKKENSSNWFLLQAQLYKFFDELIVDDFNDLYT